jgi:mRNA interferase HicA
MKRRDLVRKLEQAGWTLVRSKGPHDVYGRGTQRISVPRHREVKEFLALKILKEAGLDPSAQAEDED